MRTFFSPTAWMPGAVRAELEADPHPYIGKRSTRDKAIDFLMIVVSALIGLHAAGTSSHIFRLDDPFIWLQLVVGAISCLSLLWRRRWPLGLATVLTGLSIPFTATAGAAMIALFTLAIHRPLRYSLSMAVVQLCAGFFSCLIYPPDSGILLSMAFGGLFCLVVVGWGTSVRNRRQLLISLAERARRAEAEQRERIANARATERERLAREMHDVLAHRMSLVSVHAGALEYRPDARPEDIARAAGVIRSGVHQMLEDLRSVISMLRGEGDDLVAQQDSLVTIDKLISEARAAGNDVSARIQIADADAVPGVVSRTAYRVIQEGLTNARKHAGPVPVYVTVIGRAGRGVTIEVSQPLNPSFAHSFSGRTGIPGAGSGLIGLAERVTLAGGTLDHGVVDHRFSLTAYLPWEKGNVHA